MMTKINWFKEVLELEPGSKVFFPLARLYFDDGNYGEAMATLRQGLSRNPDHLEARFMLVEILSRLGRAEEATLEVQTITGMLSRYPAFWTVWSQNAAPSSRDSATALSFLAASFQGTPLSWSQVIEKGLDALFKGNGVKAEAAQPQADVDEPSRQKRKKPAPAKKPGPESDATIRTRTMADLLADQGDFQGALDIYAELAGKTSGHEAAELEVLIEKMRLKLRKGPSAAVAEPEVDLDEAVAMAPEPGLDFSDEDEDIDLEPTGGAQPLDVPDIEDIAEFDAQAMLDDLLAADDGDGEHAEESTGFEAELAAAPEPEFEESLEMEESGDGDDSGPRGLPGKDKLLETLEALAERLEARIAT